MAGLQLVISGHGVRWGKWAVTSTDVFGSSQRAAHRVERQLNAPCGDSRPRANLV